MPVRPIEQAKADLERYVPALLEQVRLAYGRYMDRMGPALKSLETGTKRAAVRDFIVEQLWNWADQTEGVQAYKRGNLKWIGFENNWLVRVKHLNDADEVAVSPTEDSREYNCNQIPDSARDTLFKRDLFDEQAATALYFGWRTNENTPTVPEVSFVCNNSAGAVAWVWDLGGGTTQPYLALPEPDFGPTAPTEPAVKITIKGPKQKKSAG